MMTEKRNIRVPGSNVKVIPRPGFDEKMWCKRCKQHVRFLTSAKGMYCIQCDGLVGFTKQEKKELNKRSGGGDYED